MFVQGGKLSLPLKLFGRHGKKVSMLRIAIAIVVLTSLSVVAYGESKMVTFDVTELNGETITLNGILEKPEGKGPFPAIVLLHSCDGIKWLEMVWANRLHDWGYITLQADSVTPRGKPNGVCELPEAIQPTNRALDAHAAKEYLTQLPFVDSDRIAVMGLSHGGWTVLAAVENTYLTKQPRSNPFKAAVAFYPGCDSHLYRLDAPLLILIGEEDDWTYAYRCEKMQLVGESMFNITLKVYPGATHAFDLDRPERTYLGHVMRYDSEAAEDAIKRTRQFLTTHLQ